MKENMEIDIVMCRWLRRLAIVAVCACLFRRVRWLDTRRDLFRRMSWLDTHRVGVGALFK